MKLFRALFLSLAVLWSAIGAAQAGPDVNVSTGLTLNGPGLAVHGIADKTVAEMS